MTTGNAGWRKPGDYQYLVELDGPRLAWEYVRRNPHYQDAWRRRDSRKDGGSLHEWGLPRLDRSGARCP